MTKKSPHPYFLKIRPCTDHVGHYRWEIFDSDGLMETSLPFATEREAKDNGRQEMKGIIEMWNKK